MFFVTGFLEGRPAWVVWIGLSISLVGAMQLFGKARPRLSKVETKGHVEVGEPFYVQLLSVDILNAPLGKSFAGRMLNLLGVERRTIYGSAEITVTKLGDQQIKCLKRRVRIKHDEGDGDRYLDMPARDEPYSFAIVGQEATMDGGAWLFEHPGRAMIAEGSYEVNLVFFAGARRFPKVWRFFIGPGTGNLHWL